MAKQKAADKIRQILTDKAMSDYALEKSSGVNRSTIGRMKEPGWNMELDTAEKVLNGLGYYLVIKKKV